METTMSQQDKKTIEMAMGRIFGMMMRPTKDGDGAEFDRCRKIIMNLTDGQFDLTDRRPDYVRDYGKGAQGQW
jgi:hypothetical protein